MTPGEDASIGIFVKSDSTNNDSEELLNGGIQDLLSSTPTLLFRSTQDQRGNCTPIRATVHLYRILQLDVFLS
jgi:hypothetical protein